MSCFIACVLFVRRGGRDWARSVGWTRDRPAATAGEATLLLHYSAVLGIVSWPFLFIGEREGRSLDTIWSLLIAGYYCHLSRVCVCVGGCSQDPPSWSPGNSSMHCVNSLAPMRGCDAVKDDACSIGASKAGDVPAGVFSFEDR